MRCCFPLRATVLFALHTMHASLPESPAPATSFYGSQRQPRQHLVMRGRPSWSPASPRDRTPYTSPIVKSSRFSKPAMSSLADAVVPVSEGNDNGNQDVVTIHASTSPKGTPESTRTWKEARTQCLSVEKKLKSCVIASQSSVSPTAADEQLPSRQGNRRVYGRRPSWGQRSPMGPRGEFRRQSARANSLLAFSF